MYQMYSSEYGTSSNSMYGLFLLGDLAASCPFPLPQVAMISLGPCFFFFSIYLFSLATRCLLRCHCVCLLVRFSMKTWMFVSTAWVAARGACSALNVMDATNVNVDGVKPISTHAWRRCFVWTRSLLRRALGVCWRQNG